jgi:hypothetical protein
MANADALGQGAEQLDRRTIPGLAYSLAEVECRQWHRNRGNRPFNFALRQ